MKNLYLLPTDKPSRLYEFSGELILNLDCKEAFRNQNIYITSDEEIKEGDWTFDQDLFLSQIDKEQLEDNSKETIQGNYKKIILTTDQDFIKDGVQAIDDEFLEWFVKNPSCEKVEIKTFEVEDYVGFAGHTGYPTFHNEYKIIIPKEEYKYPIGGYAPGNYMCNCSTCKTQFQGDKRAVQCEPCAIKMTKEEPKQELHFMDDEVECNMCGNIMSLLEDESNYACFNSECIRCYEEYDEEPKQETLEEAVDKASLLEFPIKEWYRSDDYSREEITAARDGFKRGVKWQQERSYSEETYTIQQISDLFIPISKSGYIDDYLDYRLFSKEQPKLNFKEWFEQFKKKK